MKPTRKLIAGLGLAAAVCGASAEEAQIAVAANFTVPMKAIIAAFEADTGHDIRASFGSTGKLYAQIKNGAPFEALLAADQKRPELLVEEYVAVRDSRFTYAIGSLVLWSAETDAFEDGPARLEAGDFAKLAIANPKLAPYGEASVQTMDALGVKEALEPKLVMGENIAQTYQFVATGNAEVGFVALSQVMEGGDITKGSGWIVPGNLHDPIRQDAVILESGKENPAVAELFAYLKGEKARAIIRDFGYETEAGDELLVARMQPLVVPNEATIFADASSFCSSTRPSLVPSWIGIAVAVDRFDCGS
jgi:molybdate transport system substrate-binding protein